MYNKLFLNSSIMEKNMKTIHLKIIFITVGIIIMLLIGAGFVDPSTDSKLEQKEIKNPFVK